MRPPLRLRHFNEGRNWECFTCPPEHQGSQQNTWLVPTSREQRLERFESCWWVQTPNWGQYGLGWFKGTSQFRVETSWSLTAFFTPYAPWCWHLYVYHCIYLQNWVIDGLNVGRYSGTMEPMLGFSMVFQQLSITNAPRISTDRRISRLFNWECEARGCHPGPAQLLFQQLLNLHLLGLGPDAKSWRTSEKKDWIIYGSSMDNIWTIYMDSIWWIIYG